MKILIVVLIELSLFGSLCSEVRADLPPELTEERDAMFESRAQFLKEFLLNQGGRKKIRDTYLGSTGSGAYTATSGQFDELQSVLDAVTYYRSSPPASSSLSRQEDAQTLGFETLEAMLHGQLIAGNMNLLKGLRVAFPNTGGAGKPAGESLIPVGAPRPANRISGEIYEDGGGYRGASITDLVYAQYHFQRAIVSSLEFMNQDSTGEIRATEPLNTPFDQYTKINQPGPLADADNFENPDAATGGNPANSRQTQTAGYLLGNILDRCGKATVGIGDRLWRAAYFDRKRAPGGSREEERGQMLAAAQAELRKNAQFQYLTSLPLAATLDDGDSGTLNAFEKCRIDQARVAVDNAQTFIDRLRRGEIPKLRDFSLKSSHSDIQAKINLIKNTIKPDTTTKYSTAESAIWKEKNAAAQATGSAQNLRTQFRTQLFAATQLNPDIAPYNGLGDAIARDKYKRDLYLRIQDALEAPTAAVILSDGSDVGKAVLSMHRAEAAMRSARNRIDAIPQQIQIVRDRTEGTNSILVGTTDKIEVYQLAIGIANSVSVSYSASAGYSGGAPFISAGVTVNKNPGAIKVAGLQNQITRAQTLQQVQINNVQAEAEIRNLLLQQHQYIIDLDQAAIQLQLAIADVKSTLSRVDRLLEDMIYYQAGNDSLWWSDPGLMFEQEQAELDYDLAVTEYKRNLYELTMMLQARWGEPFENPFVIDNLGNSQTLGGGIFDDFTQPESVFNISRAAQCDNYLAALQSWDQQLRLTRSNGEAANILVNVSLREDIFGLADAVWDEAQGTFVVDPNSSLRKENIQRFRALLQSKKGLYPNTEFVLDFPCIYLQKARSRVGLPVQPLVVPVGSSDWNYRITGVKARIVGSNVAPGNVTNTYRARLHQFGKVEVATYFPRGTTDKKVRTFYLPLYYDHPAKGSISPFSFELKCGINGQEPDAFEPLMDVEPSIFCDHYVLVAESSLGTLNLNNIEDIVLEFQLKSGMPGLWTW